jgi:hypothetical protein
MSAEPGFADATRGVFNTELIRQYIESVAVAKLLQKSKRL